MKGGIHLEIRLNEEQSKILIDIALKDLLPKELEKRKKEKFAMVVDGGETNWKK
jgi:hypothetical protein